MTSLFNPMTTINKLVKPFRHPYKGIVVQVDSDPGYIGRIKVNIPELYGEYIENSEGSTAGILPWIYPRYFGKFAGKIEFSVPEKGDIVEVDFPYENPYLGYYTNKPMAKSIWDTILEIDPEEGQAIVDKFKQHYPDVYGSIDRNLTGWYVDKITNEIFLVQGGKKANITMNHEGTIIVNSPKDMIFTAGENIIFNAGTSFKVTTPDEIHELETSLTIEAGSQIDVTTTTMNTEATTIGMKATTMNTEADTMNTEATTIGIKATAIDTEATTIGMKATTMNTEATINHTGIITSSGEGTFNGVTVSGHIHKVPQAPEGVLDSESPTPGT